MQKVNLLYRVVSFEKRHKREVDIFEDDFSIFNEKLKGVSEKTKKNKSLKYENLSCKAQKKFKKLYCTYFLNCFIL
jgi:hypothetical protein